MNLINEGVEHSRQYGMGVITEVNGDKIRVEFQEGIGAKMFIYPDAFENFLKAVNPTVQSDVMEKLRLKNEEKRIELIRIEREQEAAITEEKKLKAERVVKKTPAKSVKKK